ncbi:AAA domain-containing protein [Thomasclavelia spiroformis]|uniref:serine/threonine-protein kinase n=1 Tax=Thomasclavelia spiroformis TaxID=29348 RepID=UPI00399AF5BC
MSTFRDWEAYKRLKNRADTNSVVDVLKNKSTGDLIVRKIIYGIEQPLYQAVFTREMRALYKLNKCSNIVNILGDDYLVISTTKEKVGVIYLEYINGIELGKSSIENFSAKERFSIIKQLLDAIEISHSNGIIHRDINPNNIMLTDDKQVKLIDFGICKINDMINSATVYKLGTNAYSAPEVHQHSENATEKSDLYSLGAVIYFLFTGQQPPLAVQFQDVLNRTSGMDVSLKPILKKLVAENPDDRYENVFELRADFSKLFTRFLNLDKTIILTAAYERIKELRNLKLLPQSINIKMATETYMPENFLDLYAFCRKEESNENEETMIYIFLGFNFQAECVFDDEQSVFDVVKFRKIPPIDRDRLKKRFAKIEGEIRFVDKRIAHRELKNDSFEIKNIIYDYYENYMSNNNVDCEYKEKYGVWRDLLELIREDIEKNVVRLPYDSYEVKNNLLRFKLKKGTFIDEERLNKEQVFVYEKKVGKKKDKIKPVTVGTYENDIYEKNHVVLEINKQGTIGLPASGFICLDYRKDKINVERQLDALNVLEKEDYQCSFNLKRIISGVEPPSVNVISKPIHMFNEKLDFPQRTAIKKALDADSIAIIQGPPGTGKTNVIIEIILQILKANKKNPDVEPKKVLLVSQSHPAVDKMLEDLIRESDERPDLLRIGRDEKLNEKIREEYSINDVKEKWYQNVRRICNDYTKNALEEIGIPEEEFDKYFLKLENSKVENMDFSVEDKLFVENFIKRTKGVKSERTRKILEIQREWTEQLKKCDEVELYIIKSTVIIAGTCTGFVSNRIIRDVEFDYVIVDEAAKATFPELAVSLNKAHKIILVGDHQQLPPVLDTEIIRNNKEKLDEEGLAQGIFERMYNMFPEDNKHRLTIQYRMHPTIGTLISHVFYNDEIQNGVEAQDRELCIEGYEGIAIEWISTSKYSTKERYEKEFDNNGKKSYQNYLERNIIERKLLELDSKLVKRTKVAVITGYGSQKYILQTMVKQHSFKRIEVDVDTVDAFQGSQKDIILYSTVRSSGNKYGIGFLKSEARINVAFSRARCLLIIVGDMKFLDNYKIRGNKFPEIIKYITESEGCRIIEK